MLNRDRFALARCAKGAADMVRQMVGWTCLWHGAEVIPAAAGEPASMPSRRAANGLFGSRRRHHGGYGRRRDQTGNGDRAVAGEERAKVVVCNAPIVEGSVMAGPSRAAVHPWEKVRRAAEELVSADVGAHESGRIRTAGHGLHRADAEGGFHARPSIIVYPIGKTILRKGVDRAFRPGSVDGRQEHRAGHGPSKHPVRPRCSSQPKD